jgi:hypothetical protein
MEVGRASIPLESPSKAATLPPIFLLHLIEMDKLVL